MQPELSEIRAESNVKTFSLAARKRWIHEGAVEVCRLPLGLQKEVAKNVTAATRTYDIKTDWSLSDFLAFAKEGIQHYNGSSTAPLWTPLERKSIEWLDENVGGWGDRRATNRLAHTS